MSQSTNEPDELAGPLHRLAASARVAAGTAASDVFGGKWVASIGVARGFFDCEIPQANQICHMPMRAQKAGELVTIDFNLADDVPLALQVRAVLRMELEPFIIGVGNIAVEDTAEGLVIARREYSAPEIEITPAMIQAGWEVLAASGISNDPLEADRLVVEEIFLAMYRRRINIGPLPAGEAAPSVPQSR
jgi:hypothetical protein